VLVAVAWGRPIRYLAVDELYGRSAFFDKPDPVVGSDPMPDPARIGALRVALGNWRPGAPWASSRRACGCGPGVRVEPKRGAAWLARRARVPLLPVAVARFEEALGRGTTRVSRRPIRVTVCDPLIPADWEGAPDPLAA